MAKKLSVSEFISDKQLSKIEKIIEKSANTDDAYDKIENLLIDDFTVKDLGTNRLILINNKHDKYICKIAGDSHGIEANYREFYNGDLDEKRITKSYSISENGVFLVQEKVKPFTSDMMKKYKKDVRKMLSHLEDKLLLVDCKLSNFKNFGMRKNGDIVLLDHGDTIPLTMYRNGKIVNIAEESNVSLRCKEFKRGTLTSKHPEPCGGKLRYSKDYDYFICDKCGAKVNIHDAYKEFYGYARIPITDDSLNTFQKGFDPEEYEKYVQNSIKQYAKDMMNNVENKKETKNMKKQIKGQTCQQIKGYWLPIDSNKKFASTKLMSVKRGQMAPRDYLIFLNLNPDEYKMNFDDHMISREEKINNDDHINKLTSSILNELTKSIHNHQTKSRRFENQTDTRRNGIFYVLNINDMDAMVDTHDARKNIYYIQRNLKLDNNVDYAFFDRDNIYIKIHEVTRIDIENSVEDESVQKKDEIIDIVDNIIEDDDDDEIDEEENSVDDIKYSLSLIDITKSEIVNHMDEDCFILDGYYIPLSIINKYYNGTSFNFPDPRTVLDDNGYDPNLYETEVDEVETGDDLDDLDSDDDIDNTLEVEIVHDYDDYESDEAMLEELSKELLDMLDESGYNERGYATILYEDMYDLFDYYCLNKSGYINDDDKLTDYAINKIREFDYVEDIADYCAINSYEIAVKGKRLINDTTLSLINESESYTKSIINNSDITNSEGVSILIKLIDPSLENYDDVICAISLIHLMSINYTNNSDILSKDSIERLLNNIYKDKLVAIATYITHYIHSSNIDDDIKADKIKSVVGLTCSTIAGYLFFDIFRNKSIFESVKYMINTCDNDYEYKDFIDYLIDNKLELESLYLPSKRVESENDESDESSTETTEEITQSEDNNLDVCEVVSGIIRNAISSIDTISLNLDDLKDKNFEVHCTRNGYNVTLKIDLYSILKSKL